MSPRSRRLGLYPLGFVIRDRHNPKRKRGEPLPSKEDIAELVKTFLACDPLGGFDGPEREPFAAARRVPQSDCIRRGVESDFMRTGDGSRPARRNVNAAIVTR